MEESYLTDLSLSIVHKQASRFQDLDSGIFVRYDMIYDSNHAEERDCDKRKKRIPKQKVSIQNKRKRYKERKKMKLKSQKLNAVITLGKCQPDNVFEGQLDNRIKGRQLSNRVKGIKATNPLSISTKEIEKSESTYTSVHSNESDEPQNAFPTSSSHWHYLYEEESESDHRWDNFEKEEEEMRRCVAVREKQNNGKYEEFFDTEPCFSPCTDVIIELPKNLTPVDKTFVQSKVLELKLNEEKAKEVACYYRDRCSELKARILEVQKEQIEYKVQAIHEKNQIPYFWRNKILEGQSRSGRMVRAALNLNNKTV